MKTYSLHDKFQSAYRPAHSTETAMLRITNNLLLAADDGQVGCLVLLDLSAAFDTIDHRILLQKLSSQLHLSKSAVHWFASYLEDRYQKVVIGDETSNNFKLQYGVPQGSVRGRLLFTLYTVYLGEIIKKQEVITCMQTTHNCTFLSRSQMRKNSCSDWKLAFVT